MVECKHDKVGGHIYDLGAEQFQFCRKCESSLFKKMVGQREVEKSTLARSLHAPATLPVWAGRQVVRASGLLENICSHGISHPDLRSARKIARQFWPENGKKDDLKEVGSAWRLHGCDGCCSTGRKKLKVSSTSFQQEQEVDK